MFKSHNPIKNIALLILLTNLINGCALPLQNNNNLNNLTVNLGFSGVQKDGINPLIENTDSFKLVIMDKNNISGNPIIKTISKSDFLKDKLNHIVISDITDIKGKSVFITVEAIGLSGNTIAKGNAGLYIKNNDTNSIDINVNTLKTDLKIKLNNYPDNGSIAMGQITTYDNQKIFSTGNGKELIFKNVSLGSFSLKSTVFSKDSEPLSTNKSMFEISENITEKELNLKLFEPKTIIDLGILTEIKGDTSNTLLKSIDDKLSPILDDFIIEDTSNTVPKIKGLSFELPKTKKIITLDNNTIFLNKEDIDGGETKFSLRADDDNNDKLIYVWGLISKNSNNNFTYQRFSEKGENLSIKLPDTTGTYYLTAFVTDNKSFSGPFNIPIYIK